MFTKIKQHTQPFARRIKIILRKHLFLTAIITIGAYLTIAQALFTFTGDTWAESFAEYLQESLMLGWKEVLMPSWAGYLTVIPSALTSFFVSSGAPLGLIDYYFRVITISFAGLSAGFVAFRWNRKVIKSDVLRVIMALFLVMLFAGVSDFSFINVWYIGFVPVVFICLNPEHLKPLKRIFYVIFAVLVALTKPSIVLAPFVLYRMLKTKQYVSNGIVMAAILLQTYMLFFASPPAMQENIVPTLADALSATVVGAGMSLLKLVSIAPSSIWFIAVADIILLLLAWWLARKKGIWVALAVTAAFLIAVYSQYMAPGEHLYLQAQSLTELYKFDLKLQRDFLINIFLTVWIFLLIPFATNLIKKKLSSSYVKYAGLSLLTLGLLVIAGRVYTPIDARQAMDLSPYRHSLTMRQPVCMPLPTVAYGNIDPEWYFQDGGTCITPQKNQRVSFTSLKIAEDRIRLRVEGLGTYPLKAILLPLKTMQDQSGTIMLRDVETGQQYIAPIHRDQRGGIAMTSFNTAGMDLKKSYEFELTSTIKTLQLGQGDKTGHPAYYAYFMMPPQPVKK